MVGGFCYISIYNYSNACLVIEKTKLKLPKDTTTTFYKILLFIFTIW